MAQAERVRNTDNAKFAQALTRFHRQADQLSDYQTWYLRYLEAWQAAHVGEMKKSARILRRVIDQSGSAALRAKASALLIGLLLIDGKYKKAYRLAYQLRESLPDTHDKLARFLALLSISQLMNMAGQATDALTYARQAAKNVPEGESPCVAQRAEVAAMIDAHHLKATSPKFAKTIAACVKAGELTNANVLQADQATLFFKEGKPKTAIVLIQNMMPRLRAAGYQNQILTSTATLALAYWKAGDTSEAKQAALQVIRQSAKDDTTWSLMSAYKVLYHIEKTAKHPRLALQYYEHYVEQKLSGQHSQKEQASAYQMVEQQVQAKELRVKELDKQNKILRLQQTLNQQAAENNRLYAILFLCLLGFALLWLIRLKQSQRRFRHQACHDGLTGVFNHQHFVEQAERLLADLNTIQASACLVVMDLDHFKRVNDTYGHAAGDRVLSQATSLCRGELRSGDLFGRLGGEEFGFLLPKCAVAEGMAVVDRMRRLISETPVALDDGERVVRISASFGLAITDRSGYAVTELLADADAALYRAKGEGRNRLVVHGDERPAPPV
ncbi:GGDEF domain-containing protein [Salinisphaera sp. SPP-AMP-43]|uniref:GGDEF domain-containing protein n=1 Tax=Salinisphaera sp. SPP-AMP-43 TaxID=3121288 RepID=UPI003C6E39B3